MPDTFESVSLDDYRSDLDRLSLNLAALSDKPLIEPKTKFVVPHHWRWDDINRVLHQSLDFQDKLPVGQTAPKGASCACRTRASTPRP